MENYLGIMSAAMSILVSVLGIGDRINRNKCIRLAKQEYCEKVLCPIIRKVFFKAKLDDKYMRSLIEKNFQCIPPYFFYSYQNNNYIDFIKLVIEDYRLFKLSKAEYIDRIIKRGMRVLIDILYWILLIGCLGYAGISVLQILILIYESDYIGISENTRLILIVIGCFVITLLVLASTIHEMNNDIYTQNTKDIISYIDRRIKTFDKIIAKKKYYAWDWCPDDVELLVECFIKNPEGIEKVVLINDHNYTNGDITISISHDK